MYQFVFALLFALCVPFASASASSSLRSGANAEDGTGDPKSLKNLLYCLKNPKICSNSTRPAIRVAVEDDAPVDVATIESETIMPLPLNIPAPRERSQPQISAPPIAFQIFCLKYPDDCRASQDTVVDYSEATLKQLVAVNRAVNRSILPRRDRTDIWSIAPASGDCDDYVMTKRHQLIRAGMPPSALRAAVVRTRGGQAHAILVVATTQGDLVLDNLRHAIMEREATGYFPVTTATEDPYIWTN